MLLYFTDTAELERLLQVATRLPSQSPRDLARSLIDQAAQAGSDKFDEAVRLLRRLKAAEVDASACRTSRDWKALHELQEKWEDFSAELIEVR
jgi:hypothetical protein